MPFLERLAMPARHTAPPSEASQPANPGLASSRPPVPSFSVETACGYLAHCVHEDMGAHNGETALYWHLISVVQQHAISDANAEVCQPEKKES